MNTPNSTNSSLNPQRVLLLGATGFIGRHVLHALLEAGHSVKAAHRGNAPAGHTNGLQWTRLELQRLLRPAEWHAHLAAVDVVINCVGILRQRLGERYEDLHHHMPAAIAVACAERGVRFIHTSALALREGDKSRFLSSKRRGDDAIATSNSDYAIVRPSLIDGSGGFGASWLRMLAKWPIHFVPRAATGRISAVRADDLAQAYSALVALPGLQGFRECAVGGTTAYDYGEYLQLLRGVHEGSAPPAHVLHTPAWANRLGAHACDLLRLSPFSYGHWILLQRDNLAQPNRLPELLRRPPGPVTASKGAAWRDFRWA